MKEPADGHARAQKVLPVGRVGEAFVVEKGVGVEQHAFAIHARGAVGEHLDSDAGDRAAFGELEAGGVGAHEVPFGAVARSEGQGERERAGIFAANGVNMPVDAGPEGVGIHFKETGTGKASGPEGTSLAAFISERRASQIRTTRTMIWVCHGPEGANSVEPLRAAEALYG